MTKLESAERLIDKDGDCTRIFDIRCKDCFLGIHELRCIAVHKSNNQILQLAKKHKKEHSIC